MNTPVDADDIADSETVVTAALDDESSADAESQPPNSVPAVATVAASPCRSGRHSKPPDFLVSSS